MTNAKKKDRIPVWLVDDNRDFCTVLSQAFREGKRVECQKCFHTCRSAITALAKADNPPSVILLDIKMPKLSGLDAIFRLKQLSPGTQIIMLTSHDLDTNIKIALNRGASGYLLKRSKAPEIVTAIEDIQKGKVPIDSLIADRILKEFLGRSNKEEYDLSEREADVIRKISEGKTTEQVSKELNLSYFTVDTHVKNIYHKLSVHTRNGLVAKVAHERIV